MEMNSFIYQPGTTNESPTHSRSGVNSRFFSTIPLFTLNVPRFSWYFQLEKNAH